MSTVITRIAACAALLGMALAVAPAVAAPGGNRPGPPPKSDCRAPGRNLAPVTAGSVPVGSRIRIEGSGEVRLRGSFMSWGTVSGMDIKVVDRAGDGLMKVAGRCIRFSKPSGARGRSAVVASPRGQVLVDGTDVRMEITGPGSLTISVTGTGTGKLNGVGTFTVNNGTPMSWPLREINLALAPTS